MAKAVKKEVSESKGSISKLLKAQNVASADKKKKSETPDVTGHEDTADLINQAKKNLEDAEAIYKTREAELLEMTFPIYKQFAVDGSFTKAFNLVGDETPGVQVVYQDRFIEIPAEQEEALRTAAGKDYDKYFQENRKLELAKTDDATIEFLIGKLGQATFEQLFKIKVTIGTKPDMDRKQFELNDNVRGFIKQFKGSVKIIKE